MRSNKQRVMIVWTNGERFQFENDEISTLVALADRTRTQAGRWRLLELYGSIKNTHA